MLCDGRLVCGCADPYGKRVLGDARHESVTAVWTGERATSLRADLNGGGSKFCGDCPLKLPLKKDEASPQRGSTPGAALAPATSSARPPATSRAPRPAARPRPASPARARPACSTSISSAASSTRSARRSGASTSSTTARRSSTSARSRCASTSRAHFPHIYLYTSTNGLAFTEEQARRLVHSGIDEVTFSIDGATQESYERYRQRGEFDVGRPQPARDGRREARRGRGPARSSTGATSCSRWNDSDDEMATARELAADIGVDRLCWELTDHPERHVLAPVRARLAGPRRHPARDLGRQQSRQRHSWRDAAGADRGAPERRSRLDPGQLSDLPVMARPGRPVQLATTITNLSTRPFPAQASYGRRLVRLGAQLCDRNRYAHQPRLRAGLAARDARPRAIGRRADDAAPPRQRRAATRSSSIW